VKLVVSEEPSLLHVYVPAHFSRSGRAVAAAPADPVKGSGDVLSPPEQARSAIELDASRAPTTERRRFNMVEPGRPPAPSVA
jgi:kynurenine formamidase